ncbi:hypothetical protein HY68_08945 [Streptomyces sp. AcH 505]|uniref:hypothetical protein n=1 Tax=Streptomyces sp. AcH 505 TaxID=352211 RepID=UPI0005922584|nr:hypothetical protein HY68_08945 [Streptomyces sp. AcH 505]
MNEEEVSTPAPEAAPVTPDDVPQVPAPRRRVRRILGIALPVVLVLGAVGGGAVYVKSTVDGADRTVPTKLWLAARAKPNRDPAANAYKGRTDTELSKQLLPAPEGYRLGPDLDEFGNDTSLSAQQARALLKGSGEGLPSRVRTEMNKEIEKVGIKGMAARSYVAATGDLVVETFVTQMKDRSAVADMYRNASSIGGHKGPAVKGQKNAKCFLAPEGLEFDPRYMVCTAYKGELFIKVNAFGTEPLAASEVAGLLGDQLDRIDTPGKAV